MKRSSRACHKLSQSFILFVLVFSQLTLADAGQKFDCSALFKSDREGKFLLGSYTLEKGEAEFETFALEANNSFSSWLHERPEFFGLHWQFEARSCQVVVSGEPLPSAIRFRVVDKTDQSLTVQFMGSGVLAAKNQVAIYQAL